MIILVDQDDVLAGFNAEFNRLWKPNCPPDFYIPPEKQLLHDLASCYPDFLRPSLEPIYTAPGFVRNLPPIKEGIEAVKEMLSMRIEVRICTAPLKNYKNCVLEKYQWIEHYLGREFVERVILTRDKTLVRGDFLIDDKPDIKGVAQPTWEQIIFDQPWNQRSKVAKRMFSWNDWKKIIGV